jgi:hypothetical protein
MDGIYPELDFFPYCGTILSKTSFLTVVPLRVHHRGLWSGNEFLFCYLIKGF